QRFRAFDREGREASTQYVQLVEKVRRVYSISRKRKRMRLPFMPETWGMFLPVLLTGWVLLLAGGRWENWFLSLLGVVVLVLAGLILNFFRDFERNPEKKLKPKEVLSP